MVIMTFIDPIISPERKSYRNPTKIYIGSNVSSNINAVTNMVNITWRIIPKLNSGNTITGNAQVAINNYLSYIDVPILQPGIYELEVQYLNGITKSIIFVGTQTFNEVDEYHVFDGYVFTYGNIRAVDGRLKFSHDWKCERTLGNGIAYYNSQFYVFRPRNLFTSRKDLPNTISFSPFDGSDYLPMRIHVIPEQKRINNYEYLFDPPTRIKVTYCNSEFQEISNYTYPTKVQRIQLNGNYTNFVFHVLYDDIA